MTRYSCRQVEPELECDGYLHIDTAAVARGSSAKRKSKGLRGAGRVAMKAGQAMVCTLTFWSESNIEVSLVS